MEASNVDKAADRHYRKRTSSHLRSSVSDGSDNYGGSSLQDRYHIRWQDADDLELTLYRLDEDKIRSVPTRFWKDMVVRVQYVLELNRLLRADIEHLSQGHHCPLHTCKFSTGCCAPTFYTTPSLPVNHAECDRRCQDLEEEIEELKRERSRLRQQSASVQDLVRSIGERQMTLHRDLMNSRQLEAENAMQRRLLSKLSSERDALVSVLKERDTGYTNLLQSIRNSSGLGMHGEQLTHREKELEALIQRLLGMSHALPDTLPSIEAPGNASPSSGILRQQKK